MTRSPRYRLPDAEKDALLERQAQLIEALMARIAALEAELAKPRKTSRNAHTPPSQDPGGGRSGSGKSKDKAKPRKPRRSRPGVSRRLAARPDETIVRCAERCACGADMSGLKQSVHRRAAGPPDGLSTGTPLFGLQELVGAQNSGLRPGSHFGAGWGSRRAPIHSLDPRTRLTKCDAPHGFSGPRSRFAKCAIAPCAARRRK